ncbi:hypothetical protein [Rathayibacter sp. RFBD1]|uniref:hypothetical protein n=1 Tax=Rathayibacter sp. RFBD1 TaxID=2080527 RepID=UPI0011AFFB2A|nr:hypothetical protein [Rathayibacter sp. RFBD1]
MFSTVPVVDVKSDPSFFAAFTDHDGGSLWIEMTSSKPLPLSERDKRIELTFDIFASPGALVDIVLGGGFMTANPNCAGNGIDLGSVSSMTTSDPLAEMLDSYVARRPGTGRLYSDPARSLLAPDSANRWLEQQKLLVARGIQVHDTQDRVWSADDNAAPTTYQLATARLTCSFDSTAVLGSVRERDRFRSPDLVAAHNRPDGMGMLTVSYRIEAAFTDAVSESRSTFVATEQKYDDGGSLVSTYSDDWWARGARAKEAITLAGGTSLLESRDAQTRRQWFRLGAGLSASLTVAALIATVSYSVSRSRWGTM